LHNKSQSPQTGQFNSYTNLRGLLDLVNLQMSQSPQTGQFNSYVNDSVDPGKGNWEVSIPSNGSIQFLPS